MKSSPVFSSASMHSSLILALTLIAVGPFLLQDWHSPLIAGWDGSGQYAMHRYYAEHIFPSLYGWVPQWYAGEPWPLAYPPLLSVVLALLYKISGGDFFWIFRGTFALLTLVFPLLVYWWARRFQYALPVAFLTGVFGIFFLLTPDDIGGKLGITLASTYGNGLYAQFFGSIFFVLWIMVFVSMRRGGAGWWASTLLFAAVILSNIHMAEGAFLVWAVTVGWQCVTEYRQRRDTFYRCIRDYIVYGVIAIGLSAVWIIPLLANASFFVTGTIPHVPLVSGVLAVFVPALLSTIGTWTGKQSTEQQKIVWLSALVIFVCSILPIELLLPNLPLQPFRLLPISILLWMFGTPLGIQRIVEYFQLRGIQALVATFVLCVPFLAWYTPAHRAIADRYTLQPEEHNLVEYLREHTSGRSLIETQFETITTPNVGKGYQPTQFILSSLVGVTGMHSTAWGVFRESSLSSPFIQPLRNAFSQQPESFGARCALCTDEFYNQPIETQIARARLFGIDTLVVHSAEQKERLHATSLVKQENHFGEWSVYSIQEPAQKVSGVAATPTLVVAPERSSYNWMRINEEWFLHGDVDTVLAHAPEESIDAPEFATQLHDFPRVVLFEYRYNNREEAYTLLRAYAQNHLLILFSSDDPLYQQLSTDTSIAEHVHTIQKTNDVTTDMDALLKYLQSVEQRVAPSTSTVQNFSSQDIQYSMNEPYNGLYTSIVHQSYFPWWQAETPARTYLASPSLILVVSEQSTVSLHWKTGYSATLGAVFSLCTLLGLTILILYTRKKAL